MNFKGERMPSAPVGGAALYLGNKTLYNVEGGHRAIVFNCLEGIKDKVYPEGTHIIIPWFKRPIIYDVRTRPNLVESTSGSRDLQMLASMERCPAEWLDGRCGAPGGTAAHGVQPRRRPHLPRLKAFKVPGEQRHRLRHQPPLLQVPVPHQPAPRRQHPGRAGVIDVDYCGLVGVVLFNHSEADFIVKLGYRAAQMIVQVIARPEVAEVEDLDATIRWEGVFGFTDV